MTLRATSAHQCETLTERQSRGKTFHTQHHSPMYYHGRSQHAPRLPKNRSTRMTIHEPPVVDRRYPPPWRLPRRRPGCGRHDYDLRRRRVSLGQSHRKNAEYQCWLYVHVVGTAALFLFGTIIDLPWNMLCVPKNLPRR